MGDVRVDRAAAGRVRERSAVRRVRGLALTALLAGEDVDPSLVDTPARQFERARLLGRDDLARALGTGASANRALFEAVVGVDDRLPRRFLREGELAARPVGRIAVPSPAGTVLGTGFLITPQIVLTNHHVLASASAAAGGSFQLDYWETGTGEFPEVHSFRLQPQELFLSSSELDFTLVAVESSNGRSITGSYGTVELISSSGKALVGEHVNIVQHSGGRPQTLSIRANTVVDVFDDWIHYTSDTEAGASGSPLFNDSWQLVGLHHATVPAQDKDGYGRYVNEGIRISSIVARLQR